MWSQATKYNLVLLEWLGKTVDRCAFAAYYFGTIKASIRYLFFHHRGIFHHVSI